MREEDDQFMAEALALARSHLGQTASNPSVGCVIVKDGTVVARAVTAFGGRPHAETQALEQAGEAARGATAYVTLEPCAHFGRTPPCANALVDAGVGRVVVALVDPDERVSGKGLAILREAGIEVETGVREREARHLLAGYLTKKLKNRPHVTVKMALSSNGMIGRRGEGQVRITGDEARQAVHRMRAESDAILVGIGTALADDPELTCRLPGMEERSPIRVVLDPELHLPADSKLTTTAHDVPVIAVAKEPPPLDEVEDVGFQERRATLDEKGVEVLQCNSRNIDELLLALASRGISSLMVEGGGKTVERFLSAGLVDRIALFTSPEPIDDGIASPLTKNDIPGGFVKVAEAELGRDHYLEFERDA